MFAMAGCNAFKIWLIPSRALAGSITIKVGEAS